MATDGPTPPDCNQKVLREGRSLFLISRGTSNSIENWVQLLAKEARTTIDWHWFDGPPKDAEEAALRKQTEPPYARIVHLGDEASRERALEEGYRLENAPGFNGTIVCEIEEELPCFQIKPENVTKTESKAKPPTLTVVK